MKRSIALMFLGLATSSLAYYGLHRRHIFPPFADSVEIVALEKSAAVPPVIEVALRPCQVSSQDYVLSSPVQSQVADSHRAEEVRDNAIAKVLNMLSARSFGVTLKVLDPRTELPWDKMLSRGRPPAKDKNEVAMGGGIEATNIDAAGTRYEVVGSLRSEIPAFRRCLLTYDSPALSSSLMKAGFQSSRSDLFDTASGVCRRKPFPGDESLENLRIIHSRPLQFFSFLVYVLGVGVLYWGGIRFSWQLIERLKDKSIPVLHDGLAFLYSRRRCFFVVNYVYFGTATILYLLVYFLPGLQGFAWSFAQELVRSRTDILGWAGEPYRTGSVAYAALVTLVINLFRGTLVDITLPSMVIPGVGMLTGMFRALLWGVVLSPTTDVIAHKFKLVSFIEGEAYVLAMLFAVQIYRAVAGPKGTRWSQYKRALVVNLEGVFMVAVVLAMSAVIEAVVVLVFMKRL